MCIRDRYPPAFVGECQKSIDWSESMARKWLASGMFDGDTNSSQTIDKIIEGLGHNTTLAHERHLPEQTCVDMGLKISLMEKDPDLQDAVLSVHHAFMLTFDQSPAVKVIENQKGGAYVQTLQTLVMRN